MSLGPHYDLARIKDLVLLGRRIITGMAVNGAAEMGFDESDIEDCVGALTDSDFYKTMESEQLRGAWQDVYRPVYCGIAVYLKLQLVGRADDPQAVVIQFKRK